MVMEKKESMVLILVISKEEPYFTNNSKRLIKMVEKMNMKIVITIIDNIRDHLTSVMRI